MLLWSQFSAIFGENLALFSQTNVVIKFLHNLHSFTLSQNRQFLAFFSAKIISSVTGSFSWLHRLPSWECKSSFLWQISTTWMSNRKSFLFFLIVGQIALNDFMIWHFLGGQGKNAANLFFRLKPILLHFFRRRKQSCQMVCIFSDQKIQVG
jgi:hypothetical protein